MSKSIHVLAFAGSTRTESFTKKLARAAAGLGEEAGVTVTTIDLRDYPLPLYDGDLEESEGLPPPALELKKLIHTHDAVVISSPEYNASVSAVLKNTIDWLSRSGGADDPGAVLKEKPVALLSASPGVLGGIRALNHLRAILLNLGTLVIPAQFALSQAHEAFDESGALQDEASRQAVRVVLEQLAAITRGLNG